MRIGAVRSPTSDLAQDDRSLAAPVACHGARFESVGTALPEARLTTRDLLDRCRHKLPIDLERITGIHERRVCGEEEDSFTLARDAALDCLAQSRLEVGEIEIVINCSITRFCNRTNFVQEPPLSCLVKRAIGAHGADHFDLTNACAGMLTGILLLESFIRSGRVKNGMVVSGEYITSLSDSAEREIRTVASRQIASLTLGDGGAAVILERGEEGSGRIEAARLATFAKYDSLCIGKPSKSGPGGAMYTRARKLHAVAIEHGLPLAAETLAECGLTTDDVNLFIPHQTSTRAIKTGTRRFLGDDPSQEVAMTVVDYGNTSSTTTLIALNDYLKTGGVQPGGRVLLLCFASGLVVGAVVFTLDEEMVRRHERAN